MRGNRQVGIVAALPGELAPLVQGWARHAGVWQGNFSLQDGSAVTGYAVASGMGAERTARGFGQVREAASAGGGLDGIVSYGWAGALSCGVKPPDVYTPSEVIDMLTGESYVSAYDAGGTPLRLLTLDHVARAEEKRALAERYKAVLVDMEAATVARLAQAHHIPFYCLKGISDAYTDVLPDFNRFLGPDRQLRMPAFLLHALLRPRYWSPLAKIGSNSKAAARNLALHLPKCFEGTTLVS